MSGDPPEWRHLQPDPAHGDYLNEAGKRALAQARARRDRLAEIAASRPDPGGPAALIKALPAGYTVRAWDAKSGLWLSRLWALLSVEGWLRQHLGSTSTDHPADCFHDAKTKRQYCAELCEEFCETGNEVWSLLRALDIGEGEAVLSPDFAVWRSGKDVAFLPITRGNGEPRTLRELARQAVAWRAQIGDPEPREPVEIKPPPKVAKVLIRFHVYRVPGGFSIRRGYPGTCEPGEEFGTCSDDPVGGVVSVALGLGLPHMQLLWEGEDVSGICVAMTAGNDAAVQPKDRRANPVIQRMMAADRQERVKKYPPLEVLFGLPPGRLTGPKSSDTPRWW